MTTQFATDAVGGSSDFSLLCRQFTDCSPLPMAAVDSGRHIVRHVNPAFCSLVGKNKDELLGKSFAKAVPEVEAGFISCLDRVALTGSPGTYVGEEVAGRPARRGMFSLWPVHAAGGGPGGIVILAMETAGFQQQPIAMNQKDEEVQLDASVEGLTGVRAAIDEHAIVAITDSQGRIIYVNDKFCAISKFARQELLGQDYRIISSGFHSKEFIRDLWTTIGHGKVWKGEIKNRAKDSTFYWVDTTIVPSLDAAGKPFQYVAIRTDITERKNTELALMESQRDAEHANRAKDDFIAALSHELRTPLTPLLLVASSLADGPSLEPGLRAQIEMIRQNAELEVNLIDDLLDITKIARNKLLLRLKDVDLHQLIFRAMDFVGQNLSRKRIKVEIHTDALRSRATADPTRIQQVFWNVIKNAAKFTPEEGSVHVRTFNGDEGTLVVEIRDTGMGIAPENLASIFTSFEQGAATGIHRFGGLGLGMSITKAILELHGGSISVASEGVGQGATFTIRLPVSESVTIAHQQPNVPRVERAHPLHILLVEDHEHTRTTLTRLLSRDGHCVEAVASCSAAFHAAKAAELQGACPFEAIVSDLGLPDGSGLEIIGEIKARFPGIISVAVSGFGTDEDIRKSAEAGFKHHLVKPISFEELRHALASCLRTKLLFSIRAIAKRNFRLAGTLALPGALGRASVPRAAKIGLVSQIEGRRPQQSGQ